MRLTTKLAASAAALIATTVWAVPAQAAPVVAAAGCPSVSGGGATYTSTWVIKSPNAPVWNGPASACTMIDRAPYATTVYRWCSWFNSSTGNWWTYTNWGWIYAGNLASGIDDEYCG